MAASSPSAAIAAGFGDDKEDDFPRATTIVKLPKLIMGYKEGNPLKQKAFVSSLLLSGTKANKLKVNAISRWPTEEGWMFLESSMDISNSLLFHPDLYNTIIGWGKPCFEPNSHKMVAMREAAMEKKQNEGTIVHMFSELSIAGGGSSLYLDQSRALILGRSNNMQLYHHLELSGERCRNQTWRRIPKMTDYIRGGIPWSDDMLSIHPSYKALKREVPAAPKSAAAAATLPPPAAPAASTLPPPVPAPDADAIDPLDAPKSAPLRLMDASLEDAANAVASAVVEKVSSASKSFTARWKRERRSPPTPSSETALTRYTPALPCQRKHTLITSFDGADEDEGEETKEGGGEIVVFDRKKPRLIDYAMHEDVSLEEEIVLYYRQNNELALFKPSDIQKACWDLSKCGPVLSIDVPAESTFDEVE
jgi:hypothetical protein